MGPPRQPECWMLSIGGIHHECKVRDSTNASIIMGQGMPYVDTGRLFVSVGNKGATTASGTVDNVALVLISNDQYCSTRVYAAIIA